MRLPRKFLICSHLLGCAFSDQHDHRPFRKVVDVGREREAISQDFEASPGMIARLHKFYNKSHDQYLRRTKSTWSCKGTMLCRTLQLATFAQSVATQFAEGALFNENFYKCKYVLSRPWEGRPCYDHPTADGLRGPVWCRDEEAGNQILIPHPNTPVENAEQQILDQNPRVLLTKVESLNNSAVQRKISKLKLSYIAIDEAQVNLCNLTYMTIWTHNQKHLFDL